MERIKTRGADGRQNLDYYKTYYQENKERLAQKFKDNYQRIKADPVLLDEHRKRCTEATRRYRERHPGKVKPSQKQAYLNRRRKVFEMLGGAVCANCGCNVLEFLELNHKNGGGCKEHRILGNSIMDKLNSGELKPEGYNVLCRVCNALDHLKRKNPGEAMGYSIDFTGKQAEKING